jgi:hypothetical protein
VCDFNRNTAILVDSPADICSSFVLDRQGL